MIPNADGTITVRFKYHLDSDFQTAELVDYEDGTFGFKILETEWTQGELTPEGRQKFTAKLYPRAKEAMDWVKANAKYGFTKSDDIDYIRVTFENDRDAVLFKLFWC